MFPSNSNELYCPLPPVVLEYGHRKVVRVWPAIARKEIDGLRELSRVGALLVLLEMFARVTAETLIAFCFM